MKYNVYYVLNRNNEFISELPPKNLEDEIKRERARVYMADNIAAIKIPYKYFKDNRKSFYYFATKPSIPLYMLYKEYEKVLDEPDPIYGGSISYYTKKFEKLKGSDIYLFLQLSTLLKISSAILLNERIEIDRIEMRVLWELEEIAWNYFDIMFSYIVGGVDTNSADIVFVPSQRIIELIDYAEYAIQTIKKYLPVREHIKIMIMRRKKMNKKEMFIYNMLEVIENNLKFLLNLKEVI